MSSDPPPDGRGAVDSETFEEWLQQAADSKGVSKQELMNQMLSSYWILDELTGLVGETERDADPDHRSPGPHEQVPEDVAEKSDAASSDPNAEEQSIDESVQAIQEALRELVERQSAAEARQTAANEDAHEDRSNSGIVAVVSDLQRQVGRFDSDLEELDTRQDTQFERLSNELQLLLDRVSGLEAEHDQFARESDLDAIRGDVGKIDERVETLRTSHSDLEERIDREFDSIEALFRRLLDAIDELDAEITATSTSYQDELEPIKEREADRKRLRSLKSEALRREIRRGACQSCGQGVDLAMLESPECPKCNSHFTGIDDGSWNPFRSPTLETGPIDDA
jgi:predicted Zn-ribbon and HTH transcriptional regulator